MKTLHILLDGLQLMSSTDWELRFDLPAGEPNAAVTHTCN